MELHQKYKNADVVAENQAKLADLARDYEVTREVFEEMLSRKENAELSMAITRDGQGLTYKIVDPPVFPLKPSGLTFFEFLIAAPILAIGVPIGMLLALIILDPRIRVVSALEPLAEEGLELLAVSPHYHTNFATRLVKKDMVILAVVVGLLFCLYGFSVVVAIG